VRISAEATVEVTQWSCKQQLIKSLCKATTRKDHRHGATQLPFEQNDKNNEWFVDAR
jgi:hypothetical protein